MSSSSSNTTIASISPTTSPFVLIVSTNSSHYPFKHRNPVDEKLQTYEFYITNFPFILGCDLAGIIVEVGSNVTHLSPGDRVMGHAVNIM